MTNRHVSIGTVSINAKAKRYIRDILKTRRLSYGPYSMKFEKMFARLHNSKFAILSNSGTSALQVGLHAMKEYYGWKDGDEVIVPSVTFVATVNIVLQNQMKPVFVDVDPQHYDLDVTKLESVLTNRTRAIIPVNILGQPANLPEIARFAQKHNLKIMEDSCETMFAKIDGKPVGSWGDVGCFSTYAAHLITTGVGGITTAQDPDLATLMKSLFNHGRDNIYLSLDDDDDTTADNFRFVMQKRFNFIHVGYSYRVTEFESAIGLAQLEEYSSIIRKRKRNASYLTKKLSRFSHFLQLPSVREGSDHVFMNYPIIVRDPEIVRDDLTYYLETHGIETRYLLPLIYQPIYRSFGIKKGDFPVADTIDQNGFYIGCHSDLTQEDLEYAVYHFEQYFNNLPK